MWNLGKQEVSWGFQRRVFEKGLAFTAHVFAINTGASNAVVTGTDKGNINQLVEVSTAPAVR